MSAQMQLIEAYPSQANEDTPLDWEKGRDEKNKEKEVEDLFRKKKVITSHPSIPGRSVTSSPCVKMGFTVIWKYGGSAKHIRRRPRKGHCRRNFTPIKTCKREERVRRSAMMPIKSWQLNRNTYLQG